VLRRVGEDPLVLREVFEWAQLHLPIIARASEGRVGTEREVAMLAFVADESIARRVRDRLGAEVRVRLLTPVPAGARWVGREL